MTKEASQQLLIDFATLLNNNDLTQEGLDIIMENVANLYMAALSGRCTPGQAVKWISLKRDIDSCLAAEEYSGDKGS